MPDLGTIALTGGPWGIIGFICLSIVRGWLVPSLIHKEVRADRDSYKLAAETALKASTEMTSHVDKLTSAVSQLTTAVDQQHATQRETLSLVRAHVATSERAA